MRLIVNADDFGISTSVNAAVIQALRRGVLTSCSLMVTGEAFADAVHLAKENPRLAVGIHLVTVMGRSVLPYSEIPSLVDHDGHFRKSPVAAGLKYYFSRRARTELRRELTAQFEKFKSTGLPCSHIDAHLHMQVHPVIFEVAVRLGEQYDVRRMRVPVDELKLALRYSREQILRKMVSALIFLGLGQRMKCRLRMRRFVFADRVYGHFQSGKMSAEYFLDVVQHLHSDINEIYFHPACNEASQPIKAAAALELEALTDRGVVDMLAHSSIKLTNYFGLDSAP